MSLVVESNSLPAIVGENGELKDSPQTPADDQTERAVADLLKGKAGLSESGAQQLSAYFVATYKALGVIPSQKKIVLERFFDERSEERRVGKECRSRWS